LEKDATRLRPRQPLLPIERTHQADRAVSNPGREIAPTSVHPDRHEIGLRVGRYLHSPLETFHRELHPPRRIRVVNTEQLDQGGAVTGDVRARVGELRKHEPGEQLTALQQLVIEHWGLRWVAR